MNQDFFQEYAVLEREHWWFLARKEILRDQVKRLFAGKKTIKILNVGAAWGASTLMLDDLGEVTSLEYSTECCEYAKKYLGLDFINGSILKLPFGDNAFDLVCAFDVVEHVQDDALAIKELHRVSKYDGYVFTTVPAFNFMWSVHDDINQHIRRYTMKNYLSLFQHQKFPIVFKSYFNFWLLLPIAIFRVSSSFFKKLFMLKNSKSDNGRIQNGFITSVLFDVFKSETHLLKRGIQFPVGVSLMVISFKSL